MSPKRRPGFQPKLCWYKTRCCGRVRIPGRGTVYLGDKGSWPDGRKKPPREIEEAYRREVAAWNAAAAEGTSALPPKGTCTLKQLAAAYGKHCLRYYTKRGKPTQEVHLIKTAVMSAVRLYGSLPAADFGKDELKTVRAELERSGRYNREVINALLQRIRRMFRWAAEEADLLSEDVWLRLRVVGGLKKGRTKARESAEVKPVSDEHLEAVLPHVSETLRAMMRLQRFTGMRPIEVCRMRAGDVGPDPEEPALWLYRVRDDANKLAHHGIPRTVWIGPRGQDVLRPWLERAQAQGVDTWVFPRHRPKFKRGEGCITPGMYGFYIRQACKAAGVPNFGPNQIRHSRATQTRQAFGLEGSQGELGHERVETTQIYAQRSADLVRRIARETG